MAQKVVKKGDNGSVRIELLPSEDYRATVLEKTIDAVAEILAHGEEPSKIAVLVRANKDIPDIADAFANDERLKDVRLVSDEAFRLDSSLAVNMIITAMRLLTHPDDAVSKALLVKNYHQYILRDHHPSTELIMSDEEMNEQLPGSSSANATVRC